MLFDRRDGREMFAGRVVKALDDLSFFVEPDDEAVWFRLRPQCTDSDNAAEPTGVVKRFSSTGDLGNAAVQEDRL